MKLLDYLEKKEGKPSSERENIPSERENIPSERENIPSERENIPSEKENIPSEKFRVPWTERMYEVLDDIESNIEAAEYITKYHKPVTPKKVGKARYRLKRRREKEQQEKTRQELFNVKDEWQPLAIPQSDKALWQWPVVYIIKFTKSPKPIYYIGESEEGFIRVKYGYIDPTKRDNRFICQMIDDFGIESFEIRIVWQITSKNEYKGEFRFLDGHFNQLYSDGFRKTKEGLIFGDYYNRGELLANERGNPRFQETKDYYKQQIHISPEIEVKLGGN